ncbi:MAG TPA: aldo/keto reductase [Nitrospiria bacterium]
MMRPLGKTGLKVYPLGFGCYRVEDGNPIHEQALRAYLKAGGNLIDTSANYTDGLSEQLIGKVLKDTSREDVVVVTKAGYIQGRNMDLARNHDFPETVKYGEDLWHCIHPDFLDLQLKLSAERLQVETVNVFLLHNPEYFLSDKGRLGRVSEADQDEFYRRIREAFLFLEEAVRGGRIQCYGISSNHFGYPLSNPEAVKIDRCLSIAGEISAEHHFQVVQFPLNLFEPGAALEKNNGGLTALEFCGKNGIGVLTNRPLNAFAGGRMLRLADFAAPGGKPPGLEALKKILEPLREVEIRFAETFSASREETPDVADRLEEILPKIQSTAHFEHAAGPFIIDPIRRWLAQVHAELEDDPKWPAWQKAFAEGVNRAIEEMGRYVAARDQKTSDAVRELLFEAGFPRGNAEQEPLSRMAVGVLLSLPGLSAALAGMRRPEYVRDLMGLPDRPPVEGASILKNLEPPAGARFEA